MTISSTFIFICVILWSILKCHCLYVIEAMWHLELFIIGQGDLVVFIAQWRKIKYAQGWKYRYADQALRCSPGLVRNERILEAYLCWRFCFLPVSSRYLSSLLIGLALPFLYIPALFYIPWCRSPRLWRALERFSFSFCHFAFYCRIYFRSHWNNQSLCFIDNFILES